MLPFNERYPEDLDEKLVELVCNGSPDALSLLLSLHEKLIYNIAVRALGDLKHTDEFTREVLLKAFINVRSVPKDSSFRIWLYNQVIMDLDRTASKISGSILANKRLRCGQGADCKKQDDNVEGQQIISRVAAENLCNCFNSTLLFLPFTQRIIFISTGIFDIPAEVFGLIAGLSTDTVRNEMAVAESKMRDYLISKNICASVISPKTQLRAYLPKRNMWYTKHDEDTIDKEDCILLDSGKLEEGENDLINMFRQQPFIKTDITKELVKIVTLRKEIKEIFRAN